jgi:hypothetical protein
MMRALVAAGLALFALAGVAYAQAYGVIDLDVAGNLDAIRRSNPEHYAKIERILAEVPRRPPSEESVATWMRTEFEARNVRYTDLIMTSLPPKKRLQFLLDNKSYVKVVALTGWTSKPMPAKKVPPNERSTNDPPPR